MTSNSWNRFCQRIIELNLFTTDYEQQVTIDDDDDDDHNTRNSILQSIIQQQRISTRVYIITLIISLLILITWTMLSRQTKVLTIYNPSLEIYEKFQKEYPATLNCPCKTTTMPYKNFINTKIIIHQICSSSFISQQWINALHIPDSSRYSAMDFRTTANAQFNLLKTLCKLVRANIFDASFNLNNTQLFTPNALPENAIFIQTKMNSEQIRINTLVRFSNALKLIQLSTYNSRISTALNTNYVFGASITGIDSNYPWFISDTSWYRIINNKTIKCYCGEQTCSFPAGFYSLVDIGNFDNHVDLKPYAYNASDFVPGFVGSCTPLEAVLQTTFDCLYEMKCITKLSIYFPRLIQMIHMINPLNTSITSKYPLNVNVSHLIENLFLEQWNISIDYKQYYIQCSPEICIYSYTKRFNFIYIITLLISLGGGLQTILRLCIPVIVKYFIKKRINKINNINLMTNNQMSIRSRLIKFFTKIKNFLMNLNLFESTKRSPEAIYRQRLSTKFYLCFLIGFLFILLLFTTISKKTTNKTYKQPTYNNYKQLYMKYSDKLICPCTKITTNYSVFINITPIYHPICSSVFVTKIWFDQLRFVKYVKIYMSDWRLLSLGYFEILTSLCKFTHDIINNHLQEFRTRTIVTTRLLDEISLNNDINEILKELIQSMKIEFKRINNILSLLFQINQYFTGVSYNGFLQISNEDLNAFFFFSGPTYNYGEPKCLCAFYRDCEESAMIIHNKSYIPVPGFVIRCSTMDSILHSTLECLYSDTNCLTDILLHYMNYTSYAVYVSPLNKSQLIRTSSNSKIITLVDNLFIEEWKTLISHRNYFQSCSPIICQYTYVQRANYLFIITVFFAVYGGLIFLLRLLIPLIVKFVLRFRHRSTSVHNQDLESLSRIARYRVICRSTFDKLRIKIIELNLFRNYSFDNNNNENTNIQFGRLTTRLYLCLYTIGLIILALFSSIEQRTLTKEIYNPTLSVAQEFQMKYTGTMECPCTKASIPIEEFLHIQPDFHQICTSTFVSNEWYDALATNLDNMTYFVRINDYRPFLLAHLQFLSGLCQQAIKHVNDTIHSFTSTSFVTSRLLSQSSFDTQISNLLNQTETNILMAFIRDLQLVEAINYDNKLFSIYQSNYRFFFHQDRTNDITLLYTQPVIYGKSTNCSCGLQSNCVTQAAFIWPNYVEVKGLFIGCLPSQSLLVSTLECFFDIDCINLIRKHMNGDINQTYVQPLNINNQFQSQFKINTTVNELVLKLFIEKWSTKIYYNRYFDQCAPNNCSYSYIDNANPLYIATNLLGLYGGLTVVLSWWCPQFVKLIRRFQIRCKRTRQIRVVPSIS